MILHFNGETQLETTQSSCDSIIGVMPFQSGLIINLQGGKEMNKKKMRKLSIFLLMVMCLGIFSACGDTAPTTTESPTTSATPSASASATPEPAPKSTTPLVVGYDPFSQKFSPFFAESGYDQDVINVTSVGLLTTDRVGGIVYNAIKGETIPYNGKDYTYTGIADLKVEYNEATNKTVYTWTIRDDVKFSDGHVMDADDIIFSYYVFCDPAYHGASTVYSVPIVGVQNYRTQTSDEVYKKFDAMFDAIYAAGEDHVWSSSDSWTKEQQDAFWAIMKEAWIDDVQSIVDYVISKYMSYAPDYMPGFTEDQIKSTEGLQVAMGMALWGFGEVADGTLTTTSGKTFDLAKGTYPTIEDYYNETYIAYDGDPEAYWDTEQADEDSVVDAAKAAFISTEGPKDPSLGGKGIPNIEGIKKLSQTQVSITVEGFDASAVYRLGIAVAPLHYYGDESKYDYENNKFGFDFGDLSGIEAKTTMPMGAGPYRFIKFENKVIYFEANEYYYKGVPQTYYMQFKETVDADKIPGVATGVIDIANPSFSQAAVDSIIGYNSNGTINGDKVITNTVNNLGYGYIGINAATVNVGGVSDSEASLNLRRGLATILAVYRDLSVDSYYGERASVINYPISDTSWAAPQKSDDGYKVAFSTDINGKDIYTSDMNAEARYEAALKAAIEYFKAAGYTFDEASGKFTKAPEGAKLSYEIMVPGDGQGNHPSFMLANKAKEALASIGFELIINDPADSNVMWDKLDAGVQEMWCAAWGATIDPDMYQIYHSSNIVGKPGATGSNHYHIEDAQLDKLIMDARKSDDQSYRKATYKAALDRIIYWAVEIPIYQRQNCVIFSPERIDMSTVTPDITTYWEWWNDLEQLKMKN